LPLRLLADPKIARLFAALSLTGGETRIVGGAVRDSLLGRRPMEVDLATTSLPEAVMEAARAAGLKCAPTGIDHGTVTLIVEGTPFEVTTLREDVETFGRHAKVRFGDDFEKDAQRRDFTINALSLSPDGRLHDYTGGLADLDARHIRFIGDPATRIAEDHLRVLRFFRFHASFGDGALDPAGLHAAIVARDSLRRLSAERIRAEILKLLVARGAVAVAREISHAGILEVVVGASFPARLARLAAIEAALGRFADPLLRLVALTIMVEEDADRLRERLRLSNAEHKRAAEAARLLVALHGIEEPPTELELTRLLFLHGRDSPRDALALAHAESRAAPDDAGFLRASRFLAEAPTPDFPVKAADLMARGFQPGRALGAVLKELQAKWIRAGFPKDPAIVTRLVEEATKSCDSA
jgi:poly(A) polymerase